MNALEIENPQKHSKRNWERCPQAFQFFFGRSTTGGTLTPPANNTSSKACSPSRKPSITNQHDGILEASKRSYGPVSRSHDHPTTAKTSPDPHHPPRSRFLRFQIRPTAPRNHGRWTDSPKHLSTRENNLPNSSKE